MGAKPGRKSPLCAYMRRCTFTLRKSSSESFDLRLVPQLPPSPIWNSSLEFESALFDASASSLFVEDRADHRQRLEDYAEPELEGDEWPGLTEWSPQVA